MINEPYADALSALWQNQPNESEAISLEEIWRRAQEVESRNRRKLVVGYIATLVLVVLCIRRLMAVDDAILRTGCWLLIGGGCVYLFRAHKKVWYKAWTFDVGVTTCFEFYRTELVRSNDYGRRVGPLLPGMAVCLLSVVVKSIAKRTPWITLVLFLLVLAVAVLLRIRERRNLRQEIDRMEAILKGEPVTENNE